MEHSLKHGPEYALMTVHLAPGERLVAESGALVAYDPALKVTAAARGGLLGSLKRRVFGGESFFQTTIDGATTGGTLRLAPGSPGDITALTLAPGQELLIQSSCYLASTPDLQLDSRWGGARGFFSGVGLFLLLARGPGTVWISSFGALCELPVADSHIVDTGHIVAFDSTLDYRITKVGGLKSLFLSGEGLVASFQGRGRVFIQSRNPMSFASFLHPFRPVQKNSNT